MTLACSGIPAARCGDAPITLEDFAISKVVLDGPPRNEPLAVHASPRHTVLRLLGSRSGSVAISPHPLSSSAYRRSETGEAAVRSSGRMGRQLGSNARRCHGCPPTTDTFIARRPQPQSRTACPSRASSFVLALISGLLRVVASDLPTSRGSGACLTARSLRHGGTFSVHLGRARRGLGVGGRETVSPSAAAPIERAYAVSRQRCCFPCKADSASRPKRYRRWRRRGRVGRHGYASHSCASSPSTTESLRSPPTIQRSRCRPSIRNPRRSSDRTAATLRGSASPSRRCR